MEIVVEVTVVTTVSTFDEEGVATGSRTGGIDSSVGLLLPCNELKKPSLTTFCRTPTSLDFAASTVADDPDPG